MDYSSPGIFFPLLKCLGETFHFAPHWLHQDLQGKSPGVNAENESLATCCTSWLCRLKEASYQLNVVWCSWKFSTASLNVFQAIFSGPTNKSSKQGSFPLKNHSGNAEFECRMRKDWGVGWGGGSAPHQKIFSILDLKWVNFRVNSAFCTVHLKLVGLV